MEKPAITDYTISPTIAKRWSSRAFAPEHCHTCTLPSLDLDID